MIIYDDWRIDWLFGLFTVSIALIGAVILNWPAWLTTIQGIVAGSWLTIAALNYEKSDNQTDSIPEATNDH